jgi:flavin reductase (DIM6/NTAB) family NADH-FMN oxidoreductase RutF
MCKGAKGSAVSFKHKVGVALKRMLLGKTNSPQQCTVGIHDPQEEVSVWLHGAGAPRDVTFEHSIACASPFTICIGGGDWQLRDAGKGPTLEFREHDGEGRLLAELGLRHTATILTDGPALHLFQVNRCRNYCLSAGRLWAHYLHHAYLRWRSSSHIRLSGLEAQAMTASFICPRRVVLVSAVWGDRSNIFPMNLLGSLSDGYFAFSLDSTRLAAPLVAGAGTVALSGIPVGRAQVAQQLGKNHKKESVPWSQLPFSTTPSTALGIPVPCFASRVIELQLETARNLGSHTLFVSRVVGDERRAAGEQCFMVHGIYQSWRLTHGHDHSGPVSNVSTVSQI